MYRAKFLFGLTLLCTTVVGAEKAIDTSPRELKANPAFFDRQLVTVRSGVKIGFEESSFDVDCNNEQSEGVWVTFGGDVEMPVVFCCGDHSVKPGTTFSLEGIELKLKKDAEYRKFYTLLTAQRNIAPTGVPCFWDCYQYRVAATLSGHFFAREKDANKNDKRKYLLNGYGHFGCCSLFVIEKVIDVESKPTGIPIGNNFKCEKETWDLPIDKSAVVAQQTAVKSTLSSGPDPEAVGEKLAKEKMKNFADNFESGDSRLDYEGDFEKEKKASYIWLSKDKLKSYKVSFERFDWLSKIENKINDRVWTPIRIERGFCTAKN